MVPGGGAGGAAARAGLIGAAAVGGLAEGTCRVAAGVGELARAAGGQRNVVRAVERAGQGQAPRAKGLKGVGNWELLSNKAGPVGVLAGAGVASAPVEEDGEVMMSDEPSL